MDQWFHNVTEISTDSLSNNNNNNFYFSNNKRYILTFIYKI